ncbi:serine/threonine protein kinase, putative [Talaromyces stipitatus ATCC 10500]|uniref:non-specific serine/threonine protein kinase n=1 Tax=Talaromyces stipitatus (strain ATCC 10500 / CBS 375.48 / QM 6759 / NRRL 1006) TaxID=441959 RepID=B8M6S8_TALSN|nr:serine/threonine protein kinase, putative [Talaromyces stipitatus ATCC 10500]EED20148.1 serine/threonine protein kinase, putative [Talaromyces stipitatus ATCC 10500]
MTGRGRQHDEKGDLSPLSSPALGALSSSPEQTIFNLKDRSDGNLSIPSPGDPLRLSMDTSTSSNDYDQLSRSPLLEPDAGLGPSGLDRIRQQPLSRVFTLPNPSTSSVGQHNSPPHRSSVSSRAPSVYGPTAGGSIPPFEDLHRFPSESLHSFSFAQRSEELLATRQNILKRSIDFMKDRLGWAATSPGVVNAQARISGDSEFQGMVDLLSKASVLDRDSQGRQSGSLGPITSPPEVESDNVFERSFHSPTLPSHSTPFPSYPGDAAEAVDDSQLLSPFYDDNVYSRRRDLRSAPASRRVSLKRTFTDLSSLSLQSKLMETLAQPYSANDSLSASGYNLGLGIGPTLHTHSSKWTPVSQAVFRTESKAPWTIIAANDLACLVFGVTQSEVRKLSILEVVQEERRQWLESKLQDPTTDATAKFPNSNIKPRFNMPKGNGVTAQLLSKPSSRQKAGRRAQTDDGYGSSTRNARKPNHAANKSRGVLLCGDVVPIQKRNGTTGSASLWVMEKRGGLIWVLEEITENVAYLTYDENGHMTKVEGDTEDIWGHEVAKLDTPITELFPKLPAECVGNFERLVDLKYFGACGPGKSNIPTTVTKNPNGDTRSLRVSSFPHVAGMMVLSSSTLNVISSNSVFSSALFGQERPEGHHISELIPDFEKLLSTLTEEDKVSLVDGMVIPEHSFRRARDLLLLRENRANAVSIFLESEGLPARHRDGSQLSIDVQMRIVKSETVFPDTQSKREDASLDNHSDHDDESADTIAVTEVVYALWVTYSRQIHAGNPSALSANDQATTERKPTTSIHQTRSGQRTPSPTPTLPSHSNTPSLDNKTPLSLLSHKLNEAASTPLADRSMPEPVRATPLIKEPPKKRTISDYVIIEEMGQGAYGQVKLARLKKNPTKKMVLKYVTKKRILVDTWTRDRRLGTVPLEIHVLDYLRRDGLRHPNIVEMEGFFEDEINYYIEMVPHGLPGMDLFDYIELKSNMDEGECRNIFKQVVGAIHHLHTKALVVHRDIKDENVVLDGEGRIKLIDFGSAAYIKNGPFDVFVGTIDYAAPEVLQGKSYRGKEQDVWALGILLYTIVYKENPFYNVDEILDHPLRVPFLPFSEDCIDLIRRMLDRDVDNRITISEVAEHPWMVTI